MAIYHVIPFTSLRLRTQYKEGALVFSILREGDTVELVFHCICRGFVVRFDFHFKLSIVQVI
jgi:hypothetical protein